MTHIPVDYQVGWFLIGWAVGATMIWGAFVLGARRIKKDGERVLAKQRHPAGGSSIAQFQDRLVNVGKAIDIPLGPSGHRKV